MNRLRLRKREERRLRAGHPWVFSNEIDTRATPLQDLEPGQAVVVESASGQFIGHAYVNPHSLIAARLTSRDRRVPFDESLLSTRLQCALALRQQRFDVPFYRWVHSEGDLLPGLIVDRFDEVLVVQINTAGMARFEPVLPDLLRELSGATTICLANDSASRELEHLPRERRWLDSAPEALTVLENGLRFQVPADVQQKTGWFYDHRDSRRDLRAWCRDARVLDLYTYLGAFGLNAAAAGAREVLAIDASATAVAAANANAAAQGVAGVFRAEQDDVVERLRALRDAGERFDVIVLDPPAFIKRRKDHEAGTRHYGLNNRLAMQLLAPDGLLLTASCSQLLSDADLERIVRGNAPKGASVQLLGRLRQDIDHPVPLAMPEAHYLGGMLLRLLS